MLSTQCKLPFSLFPPLENFHTRDVEVAFVGGLLRKLHSKKKFGTHIKYEVELKPKQKAVKQEKKKKGIFLFEFL